MQVYLQLDKYYTNFSQLKPTIDTLHNVKYNVGISMLGEKIKQLRRLKEKTQRELGDFLGCSEAQISHIENGNRKPSFDDIRKIADFFNVPYDYFFPKQGNFVNFRYDSKNNESETIGNDLISDFKKFAINKIHGDKK